MLERNPSITDYLYRKIIAEDEYIVGYFDYYNKQPKYSPNSRWWASTGVWTPARSLLEGYNILWRDGLIDLAFRFEDGLYVVAMARTARDIANG